MDKIVINGGYSLYGEVTVSGAKNAAVAIIAASLLVDGEVRIENIPDISDVSALIRVLTNMGARITYLADKTLIINSSKVENRVVNDMEIAKMRASYYLLGALVGRFKKARVIHPGGCNFGKRPIDQHFKGFRALGAVCQDEHSFIDIRCERLCGSMIFLDVVTVGATINIMLAACRAEGTTIIENAAKEPHVVDVANFLNACGANIKGAGTDVIKIKGTDRLPGGSYSIIPDQIEAGTFMIAAAACGGDVLVKNIIPKHMESLTAKLIEAGVEVLENDDQIRVIRKGPIQNVNIKTLPYPGFPTDLQPPMVALLTCAHGVSSVKESVWDSRFQYVDQMRHMGADIKVSERNAVITGVQSLVGTHVRATDLRAGAALIIAGLIADGTTVISETHHIYRGYENIEAKLCAIGAHIRSDSSYGFALERDEKIV